MTIGSETMENMLVNRYQIIKKIGDGGMAIVYLAKDTFLDRYVAVKVLRDEYIGDKDFIARFHREAKAIASLIDPNIVNIYDYGVTDERSFLVMEYVEGKTLKQVISEQAPMNSQVIAEVGCQICSGITKAHQKNIIHKDIKPQNILVDPNGIIKVTDFGIAQSVGISATQTNAVLGSAHYFSPEQARGEYIDHRTDIYSIGVVLYEMCTGKLPYTGDNPITIALKHLQSEPTLPSKINPEVDKHLEHIILKALAKNPVDRYASAEEMLHDLEKLRNRIEHSYREIIPDYTHENVLKTLHQSAPKDESAKNILYATKRRKLKITGILVIVTTLIAFFALVFLGLGYLNQDDEISVPNVVNRDLLEAQKLLITAGLSMEISENVYHDTVQEGFILAQTPTADSKVNA